MGSAFFVRMCYNTNVLLYRERIFAACVPAVVIPAGVIPVGAISVGGSSPWL